MTKEEQVHLMIEGEVARLSPSERDHVYVLRDKFRDIIKKEGSLGRIALALFGSEEAAKL
jgi:hypothetical protein